MDSFKIKTIRLHSVEETTASDLDICTTQTHFFSKFNSDFPRLDSWLGRSLTLHARQPCTGAASTSVFVTHITGTAPTSATVAFPTKPTDLGLSADSSRLHKTACCSLPLPSLMVPGAGNLLVTFAFHLECKSLFARKIPSL